MATSNSSTGWLNSTIKYFNTEYQVDWNRYITYTYFRMQNTSLLKKNMSIEQSELRSDSMPQVSLSEWIIELIWPDK